MNNKPFISVVMSSYNRKIFLKEAIESILNQTYKNFEFIIIDDASTDGSVEVIQSYAQKDNRITLYKNEENMGCNFTARLGLSKAKGKYIARMDDDDISYPKRLEKQVNFMEKHPEIAVVGSFMKIIGNTRIKGWVDETDPDMLEFLLNIYNPICHPGVMIRKSFLDEHNNLTYNPDAIYAIEYDFWTNIILHGGKLSNIPERLIGYRGHLKRITESPETHKIQSEFAKQSKYKLLKRFFNDDETIFKIIDNTVLYPTGNYNPDKVIASLEMILESNKEKKIVKEKTIKKLIKKIQYQSYNSGPKKILAWFKYKFQ